MRLIKPYTESINLDLSQPNSILKHIETVGRNCYKSEEKITDDSYIAFIKMLINRGHYAMLEHNLIPISIKGQWAQDCFFELKDLNSELNKESLETYDTRFVNFTDDENGFVISANLRVYRDLLKFYPNNPFIQSIVAVLINNGYKIMFEDLNLDFLEEEAIKGLKLTIIIDTNKFSPIEKLYHEFKSIRFVCDRGISHEIVRHRVAAFAQESTRYVDYSKKGIKALTGKRKHISYIIPNWLNIPEHICSSIKSINRISDLIVKEWMKGIKISEKTYYNLLKLGWQAQEARSVLPNSLKTDIIVTMNLRGWKHFFDMRLPKTAHEQMRELTIPLYEKEFKNIYENMKN